MTTVKDLLYQLGGMPVGSALGYVGLAGGNVYFVNGTGTTNGTGKKPDQAISILANAYALTTNNNNDVVILVGDSSGVQVGASTSTGLTWSNSYTHLIGAGAPTMVNKRARLFHNFNASPIIGHSGSGCTWENFYFSHGRGSTDNKIGVNISGGRNYYGNVHFAGPQHATDGNQTTYSCVTAASGSSDLTFERCVFGHDSTNRGNGSTSLTFAGCQHAYVINCSFIAMANNAGATHIEVSATGIDRGLIFKGSTDFISYGTALTQAIDSNITDTTNRRIIFDHIPVTAGCTDVADATGDGTIWFNPATATANAAGLAVNFAVA